MLTHQRQHCLTGVVGLNMIRYTVEYDSPIVSTKSIRQGSARPAVDDIKMISIRDEQVQKVCYLPQLNRPVTIRFFLNEIVIKTRSSGLHHLSKYMTTSLLLRYPRRLKSWPYLCLVGSASINLEP